MSCTAKSALAPLSLEGFETAGKHLARESHLYERFLPLAGVRPVATDEVGDLVGQGGGHAAFRGQHVLGLFDADPAVEVIGLQVVGVAAGVGPDSPGPALVNAAADEHPSHHAIRIV